MDLVRELSGLLAVDGVRVEQRAEGLEVGLLFQQRAEVVGVAGEPGGNDLPDLSLDVVWLNNTLCREFKSVNQSNKSGCKKGNHPGRRLISIIATSEVFSDEIQF